MGAHRKELRNEHGMKWGLGLAVLMIFMMVWIAPLSAEAAVEPATVDSSTFPDKNFRNYVSQKYDLNKDGELSTAEIRRVTKMDVRSMDIKDLTGIKVFKALRSLHCSGNPKLQFVDIRGTRIVKAVAGGKTFVVKNIKDIGWQERNGKLYYVKKTGDEAKPFTLLTGWQKIGKSKYFFRSNGTAVVGKKKIDGSWYYFTKKGVMKTGWIVAGKKLRYYADKKGKLLRDEPMKIDGVWYYFRKDCSARKSMDELARQKAASLGSLRACFDYVRTYKYGAKYTYTESWSSKALAEVGITKGWGNCFVYAGAFRELAAELGYDAHQVWGNVPYPGNRVVKHSWVEIKMDGKTYVFDAEASWQFSKDFYQFQYGDKGTFRYQVVAHMN